MWLELDQRSDSNINNKKDNLLFYDAMLIIDTLNNSVAVKFVVLDIGLINEWNVEFFPISTVIAK